MESFYRDFGTLLRELRRQHGLTQEQLGVRVGLTRTSITNIEQGRQNIALHQLFEFANALDVSPSMLLPVGTSREEKFRELDSNPKNADLMSELRRSIKR